MHTYIYTYIYILYICVLQACKEFKQLLKTVNVNN